MKNNEAERSIFFLTPSLEMKNKISTTNYRTNNHSLKGTTLDFSISSEGGDDFYSRSLMLTF